MRKIISTQNNIDHRILYADLVYNENPKALFQIFHGMAEHRERYQYLVDILVEKGYAVLNCDERGHGQSAMNEKEKGFFSEENGWERNVTDLHELTQMAQAELGNLSLIVFGHSMGSLVARSYLKRYENEISKVIVMGSPSDNTAKKIAKAMAEIIGKIKGPYYRSSFINGLCFGAYNKAIENPRTEFDWLSINEENVDAYVKDPDCGYCFTAKGFSDLFTGMIDVYEKEGWNVQKPVLPIHFLSGELDPCLGGRENMKKNIDSLKSYGYTNITYTLFSGLRHEILNEKEKDAVILELLQFIEENE